MPYTSNSTSPVTKVRPWETNRWKLSGSIVNRTPPPKGVTTYVTGPAALVTDMHHSGNNTLVKITVVTLLVIFTMLLLVYRSVITVVLLLVMVFIELTGGARNCRVSRVSRTDRALHLCG